MRTQYITAFPAEWLPIAEVYAALGDHTRQKILLLFEPDEALSIKSIVDALGLARSTTVHHLAVLEKAGLLSQRRSGKETLYTLEPETALNALDALRVFILETVSPNHV